MSLGKNITEPRDEPIELGAEGPSMWDASPQGAA